MLTFFINILYNSELLILFNSTLRSSIKMKTDTLIFIVITMMICFSCSNLSQFKKGNMTIDVTGTIESWTVVSEDEGNIEIDIKKCSYHFF